MSNAVRVALVQMAVRLGEEAENAAKVKKAIHEAAAAGSELVVFSEAMTTGYVFTDAEEAYRYCEPLGGPFETMVRSAAREASVVVVCGMLARATPPRVENLLIIADGRRDEVAYYRKRFPIRSDKLWFEVAGEEQPVFNTSAGRFGCFICADARIPEPARLQALQSVDFLVAPSNWGGPDQYTLHVPARAIENGCWVVGVDKVGAEPGIRYPGRSCLISPDGQRVVEASPDQEEILYAEIPAGASERREYAGIERLDDRRPDLYDVLIEDVPASESLYRSPPSTIYAAAIVMDPGGQDANGALEEAIRHASDAVRLDEADLIVFPELLLHPGRLPSRAELPEWARVDREAIRRLGSLAQSTRKWIVFDGIEEAGGAYYHTAHLLGPDRTERYRKTHLSKAERAIFRPGNALQPMKAGDATLGILIGNELVFPEAARVLAMKGAECLVIPTSWRERGEIDVLVRERAAENQLYVIASNRLDSTVPGPSVIAQPAQYPEPAIVSAEPLPETGYVGRLLPLALARSKLIARNTDVLRDRRPSECGRLLRSVASRKEGA